MVNKTRGLRRWAAVLIAVALALVAIRLGFWQLGRADEKRTMSDLRKERTMPIAMGAASSKESWHPGIAADDLDQQRVVLTGQWLHAASVALDNRALDGRAGVHVLTPLKLSDGSMVWVNRGWMPKAPGVSAIDMPKANNPAGLAGVAMTSAMRRMELSSDVQALRQGNVWQNFDWQAARERVGGNVWPVIVWQSADNGDGLMRRLPEVTDDVPKHLGYAAQWFLMAVVALFFGWRLRPRLA